MKCYYIEKQNFQLKMVCQTVKFNNINIQIYANNLNLNKNNIYYLYFQIIIKVKFDVHFLYKIYGSDWNPYICFLNNIYII